MLGAPVQFGKDAGAFAPLIERAPPAPVVAAQFGSVPGSFLNSVSVAASPKTFIGERVVDRFKSLSDKEALQTHMRVERWTLDEQSMPRKLFEDVVELLYRGDRFMKGTLQWGGQVASPAQVRAPLLSVVDRRSDIVPPESVLPFHDAAGSPRKQVLWYEGDVGV
jgi:polyhydroxyalkanoate synthase